MADEKGTQKPKERVKYKFGQNDIDLTNYIHNLGTNVQSYLNSKNWNEGQKQEFMNAYNRYLTGLQDQLANNTNRFTTDDFGSIIDSTGALSNTDNDDIDPVGSEYYYDNKGNRITTDDFNLLKKRKQKNYNTFSANREVATYFNTIGNALKGMETPKEKVQDAFNLSKHGFLADWTTANNPAGGDFNLDPYLEKDAMDETTGKRGTSNRAAYLKEQIENYINNIGEYDFSSSPFKNRDTYISRLRAAAQNLENGYNSEDVIALNQAGIGNEFLSKFFATGAEEAPIKKSELELQAEQAAKEQAEREKEDQLRAVIKANEEDKYNRERDAFFTDYATQNPFQSTISGYATPSYNLQGTYNWLQGRYKFDAGNMDATKEAVKTYINFPELASIIRGGKKADNKGNDITALHIANNLDLAAQSDLLTDKVGDTGYYVVPGSENYDNWSYIAYNPVTRQYQEQSMLLNEELKKKMAYAEYDRRHKGVQKHQLGGIAKYVEENQKVATISKEDLDKLRKTKGLKAQNKLFSELTGGQQLQREFKDREINWKKPWKSRLSSDSPEVSLRTESSFLPEDNSWDARLFRGMNRNTPQRKPQKKQQETPQSRFDRLRQLSSQTGKLTPQEIATINRQRVKSGKGKLTEQEIQALNQRRQNRAGDGTDNSFQARLQRYKDAKREGKFTSVEDDIKRAKDELAEATRQQRLAVPTGQGEIVSPDANQARFIIGFSRAIPTVNPSRPPISNPPAIIPKQQVRIEQPQQSPFNYDRIREGLARAERERLGKDIGEQRLQRAIEANPERSARLQSEEAYRNVRQAFNLYGAPQYKRPLTGAAYKAKQDMYNRLFNQRRYDVIEAFRNRELPHRQSNKKKKTSRDDRRTAKREDGGTLDLVRVRKFQNAGKFPEWYSKLYKFQNLTGWNNSLNQSLAGPSITNENVGHYRAGDLNEAYIKNNSYTSNPNLVGQDLQSYYDSSFKGKSLDDYVSAYNANAAKIRGYWDQERTYKQSGAQEHNRLFKNMFGNRSDNSNNVWNIGYDSNLEDIVGSSTWLRRMDRYEKEFDNLSDEEKKSRIHKIDLGDGNFGYVYKKANGDIAVWNQPETPATSTNPADSQTTPTITSVIQPSQEPSDDNKQNKSFFSNINPTIAYGLPRAVYADRMNRRITDLAKESVVPLLKDPFEVHRYTRSDLDAEMQGERNYANLRRLASRPITSDGSLQTATQLQAEVQGQEARTAGKEKSNQVQRQYDELAWQQEKENAANRHETAMFNRAQQWGADQDKSKYEQAYLAKKFNIWDVFGQQLEYDARTRQKENKALADNFARSDIHNAISYAPNDYGANLTPDELTVWNKVLSGTNPSSLSSQEFNSYKLAAQKVSRVETEQLRQYYNVPNTRWSGKTPSTPWSPTISKAISAKNGAKIAVAGIEAKTADAERFQKQIKECIDRNEKAIDRLSKSLYGLIKASMIK